MANYKLCKTFRSKVDINKLKKNVERSDIKDDIYIIPFGSGSTGNSYYIEVNNTKVLIDCGIGVRKIKAVLEKHNRRIEDIDAILISHGHSDHRSCIKAICNNTYCDVYMTNNTYRLMCNIGYKANTICVEYDIKTNIKNDLSITAFETSHDCIGSCGFLIEINNTKIAYVTDLGIMTNNILKTISNSDIVILESNHDEQMLINGEYPVELKRRILSSKGHLSNRQSLEIQNVLYELGTKNFLLAHLSRENNDPMLLKELTDQAHKDKQDINIYICPVESDEILKY